MIHTRASRVRPSNLFRVAASFAFVTFLALWTIACAHQVSPPPAQAQAPAAAQTQIATANSAQAPLRANCGGQNQPPCGPPDCGVLNEECCTGNACRGAGLVCKNGLCIPKGGSCGGVGEPCCVNKNPMCSNYLLKCIDNVCSGGTQVSDLSVTLRTNDEDKDDASGVRVAIDGQATWSQTDDTHYDEWSTHTWSLNPSVLRLDDLAGRYVSICMLPNGDDTWKFNFLLQGNRDDGLKYEIRKDNVFLSADAPCLSWDATPDPTPKGQFKVNGKCLTVTQGGTVGSTVVLNDCLVGGGAGQEWILVPKVSAPSPVGSRTGEIRHLAQCLGLPGAGSLPGVGPFLELQTCNGSPAQQWKWFGGASTQVTGNLAKCFDPNGQGEIVVSTGNSPKVAAVDQTQHFLQYVACTSDPSQSWTLPACGGAGQACCNGGLACQDTLTCKKGACSTDPSNLNHPYLTLETTNEDKDHDTWASVAGLWSWPSDNNTQYDNWTTHQAALTPDSTPIASLAHGELFLRSIPNGEDEWKLNFIVDAVRDDGTHYEFRKDNVWLTNEGDSAKEIRWDLGPPGLDMLWKDTDANGLPLNPTWRGSPGAKSCMTDTGAGCWDPFLVCPFHPAPLVSNNLCDPITGNCTGSTPNDYGRCSSQSPTYDRSWLCGWHANWFPVTFDGTADSADFSTWPADGDWHISFRPNDPESNIGRFTLLAEFDSDETTENFISKFWKNEVDLQMIVHKNQARVIGLMGLDTEHGPPGGHGELHPTYVLQFRASGSGPPIDRWAFFVRNWGNEGYCGGSQHYLDLQLFTLRFPAPPGAEAATSVKFLDAPDLDAGSESGSSWSDFGVSGLSPVQHDANGTFVEMIFHIGPPEDHTFIDGSVDMTWMCGNSACLEPPPTTPAPPAPPPATTQYEDDDLLPGANLLTKAQLDGLKSQFPSRRRLASVTSRPIQTIPYTPSTPQAFKVGQGAVTDRTVPDTARQQRMVEIQKSICKTLPNDSKRPAICSSLP